MGLVNICAPKRCPHTIKRFAQRSHPTPVWTSSANVVQKGVRKTCMWLQHSHAGQTSGAGASLPSTHADWHFCGPAPTSQQPRWAVTVTALVTGSDWSAMVTHSLSSRAWRQAQGQAFPGLQTTAALLTFCSSFPLQLHHEISLLSLLKNF